MVGSAFKLTSKDGDLSTTTDPQPQSTAASKPPLSTRQVGSGESTRKAKKVPPRRSRSVSAFSRIRLGLDLDFMNKRDNPLYWAADSPPSDGDGVATAKPAKLDEVRSGLRSSNPDSKRFLVDGGERSGRTVSRDTGGGVGKSAAADGNGCGRGPRVVGRSLSRVTARRRRSVSRGHYGNSESEREQECNLIRDKRKTNVSGVHGVPADKLLIARSNSDLAELLNGWRTWSSQHPAENTDDSALSQVQSSSFISHWEEGGSMSSFSDAEERGFKPVPELTKSSHLRGDSTTGGRVTEARQTDGKGASSDMQDDYENVVQRSYSSSTASIIVDFPPELADPDEAESDFGIRGEYARKLKESRERARKLQAELAAEEHRRVELNKILKEIIPYPETPDVQVKKPHGARKASIERSVSKQLEEEAMAYFDECVSISTFEGSDFSSLEDPPVPSNTRTGKTESNNPANLGSRVTSPSNANCFPQNLMNPSISNVQNTASLPSTANKTIIKKSPPVGPNCPGVGWKGEFSFSDKGNNESGLEHEIRNYVKTCAKGKGGGRRERAHAATRMGRSGHRDTDDYTLLIPKEKLLLERMSLWNRIESGGLLLCGDGNVGFPFSPFSSVP